MEKIVGTHTTQNRRGCLHVAVMTGTSNLYVQTLIQWRKSEQFMYCQLFVVFDFSLANGRPYCSTNEWEKFNTFARCGMGENRV